ATLNPTSVTTGGGSTVTVAAGTAAPGTYTLTVTGTATSAMHSATVTLTVTAAQRPSARFNSTHATTPSVVYGPPATSAIPTALTAGSHDPILHSVPTRRSSDLATLNPTSVTTGGGSTVTVAAGTAAPGTYTLTVTGTATSAMHSATVTLTVTAPPASGITNGDFEDPVVFTGWARVGSTAISSTAHGGVAAAQVGSGSPFNGDSSVAQTFTAPATGGTLSFWYRVVCTDTV